MDNLEFQVLLSHFGETATLGSGTIVFIREDIPCTLPLLKPESFIELNICKKKWLISCSYNTQRNVLQTFGSLDLCISTCIVTITYYDK